MLHKYLMLSKLFGWKKKSRHWGEKGLKDVLSIERTLNSNRCYWEKKFHFASSNPIRGFRDSIEAFSLLLLFLPVTPHLRRLRFISFPLKFDTRATTITINKQALTSRFFVRFLHYTHWSAISIAYHWEQTTIIISRDWIYWKGDFVFRFSRIKTGSARKTLRLASIWIIYLNKLIHLFLCVCAINPLREIHCDTETSRRISPNKTICTTVTRVQ